MSKELPNSGPEGIVCLGRKQNIAFKSVCILCNTNGFPLSLMLTYFDAKISKEDIVATIMSSYSFVKSN